MATAKKKVKKTSAKKRAKSSVKKILRRVAKKVTKRPPGKKVVKASVKKAKSRLRRKVISPVKRKIKSVATRMTVSPVTFNPEDPHIFPAHFEVHALTKGENKKFEPQFHIRKDAVMHQENEKVKEAMALRKGTRNIFRRTSRRS